MARTGKRYDDEPKLNIKKVIAVILIFVLIIALIIGVKNMLDKDSKSVAGKIENVYYYTIYDNGKWGVINSYGETIVDANYDEMIVIPNPVQDVFICTYDVNYSTGDYKTKVINKKQKEIISGYERIEPIANYDENQNIWYEENVFRFEQNGKYGLVNYTGKLLLNAEYDSINAISGIENSLIIEKDGKLGLCDNSGNIIIEPKYKEIQKIGNNYKNGYIVVDENDKYGIIGFDKTVILEPKYSEIKGVCGEDTYAVKEDDKYSVIDKTGVKLLEDKFDDVIGINNGYVIASKDNKFGVIGISGDKIIDFKYDNLQYTNGNYYIAKSGEKYGVITASGEEKLPFESEKIEYISVGDFIACTYTANDKEETKFYDSEYNEKIEGEVQEINIEKGYIRIKIDDEYKYYNFKFEEKNANQILTSNRLFLSQKNGKCGFVDKDGNVVVDYIYDDATEQNISGYAGIKKDGVWGAIDLNGKVVVEPKYNLDNNQKIDFVGEWHLCEDPNANYYLDV